TLVVKPFARKRAPTSGSPADDAQAVAPRRRRLDFAVGATLVVKPFARKRAPTSGSPADEAQAVAPRRRRLDFAVGATLVAKPFARKRAPTSGRRLTTRRQSRPAAAWTSLRERPWSRSLSRASALTLPGRR